MRKLASELQICAAGTARLVRKPPDSGSVQNSSTRRKCCQTYVRIGVLFVSMLRFLRIRRLAVINSVEVEFDPGLNVLTGETGAGKSILVEAVGLLLGGRASADLVRTG